jgi:hypothetical protein
MVISCFIPAHIHYLENISNQFVVSYLYYLMTGTRERRWLRHYATSRNVAGSRPNEVNFSIYLMLPAPLGPGVHSASNSNEYQKQKNVSGIRARPVLRADNLAAICEPIT